MSVGWGGCDLLLGGCVFRLFQDFEEIIHRQGVQLDPDREAALQLRDEYRSSHKRPYN